MVPEYSTRTDVPLGKLINRLRGDFLLEVNQCI